MIKTKQFLNLSSSDNFSGIDERINEWIKNNPQMEIIDIKYQTSLAHNHGGILYVSTSALIMYRGNK